jgi:hypothetical protein
MNKLPLLVVLTVVVLSFLLVACSSSSLVTSLQLVTDAVTVAIPVLQAAGVDPAALALAETYLTAVSTATQEAAVELATSDPPAVKAAKIAEDFANVIAPNIGNAKVAEILKAVAAAVQEFLVLLNHGTAQLKAMPAATYSVKPSFADRRKLGSIRSQAQKNLLALKH